MASNMPLSSLMLAPSTVNSLLRKGFATVQDVLEIPVSQLAKELGLPFAEALEIRKIVQAAPNRTQAQDPPAGPGKAPAASSAATDSLGGKCALELLNAELERTAIYTLCQSLDELLGGGVPLGQVTEFCGVPGIGKTQLGMQIACSASIPQLFGGVGGAAVYVDTEGSFLAPRALQIAQGLAQHMRHLIAMAQAPQPLEVLEELRAVDERRILQNIHYFRAYDYTEQLAVIRELKSFLKQHPEVRVIVIDSVAFHFRRGFADFALRSRLLQRMSQDLLALAQKFDVAVVLVNQVTTKPSQGAFSPALGNSWQHACTHRVMLYWSPHNLELADGSEDDDDDDDDSDSDDENRGEPTFIDARGRKYFGNQRPSADASNFKSADFSSPQLLVLEEHRAARMARLLKSSSNRPGVAAYQVLGVGIRGLDYKDYDAAADEAALLQLERASRAAAQQDSAESDITIFQPPPSPSQQQAQGFTTADEEFKSAFDLQQQEQEPPSPVVGISEREYVAVEDDEEQVDEDGDMEMSPVWGEDELQSHPDEQPQLQQRLQSQLMPEAGRLSGQKRRHAEGAAWKP